MRLPNANRAIVDIAKLRDYCLDPSHPRGKHKARVFRSALGLEQKDSEVLRVLIMAGVQEAECEGAEEDDYGRRFVADFQIEWLGTSAKIRTSWILKKGESDPRLTSCFVQD